MSADNWRVCPQCQKRFPLSTEDDLTTFREDYEIGADTGTAMEFYVIYKGRCQTCGYGLEHRFTQALPEVKP